LNPIGTTQSDTPITGDAVLARVGQLLDRFVTSIQGVPYEDKGVFFSEMLFVFAAAGEAPTGPVLESGRARGQSTYLLAKIFPGSKIVSVEFDRDSPDAPVAEDRLSGFEHVQLLYGDSQKLLFDHLEPGAVVIIDGPKGFRALRLALQLLKTGKPSMVFVHDTYRGLPTRRFLENHVPGTFFSDEDRFVERFRHLDERCWEAFDANGSLEWRPAGVVSPSYGPTFACLPHVPGAPYGRLLIHLHMANVLSRTSRSVNKKLGQRGGA
jgi:hypothetical protein